MEAAAEGEDWAWGAELGPGDVLGGEPEAGGSGTGATGGSASPLGAFLAPENFGGAAVAPAEAKSALEGAERALVAGRFGEAEAGARAAAAGGAGGGAGSVLVQAVLARGGSASEAEGALAGAFLRAPSGPEPPAPAVIVLGVLLAEAGDFKGARRVLTGLLQRGGAAAERRPPRPGLSRGARGLSQVDMEVAARLLVVDVLCEGLGAPREAGAWVAAHAERLGAQLAGELAGTVATAEREGSATAAATTPDEDGAVAQGSAGPESDPAPAIGPPDAAELPDPPSTPSRARAAAAAATPGEPGPAEVDWATMAAVGAVGAALAWALYSERRALWRAARRLLP